MATLATGEIDAEKPLSALSWIRAKRRSVWPIKTGLFSGAVFWWVRDSFRRGYVNLSATTRIGGCRHADAAAGDFA
ncbi:MAG: hypothetical protein ACLPIC_16550, partial [Rhodoblastus sp.]|uniref:hypothetical protein n=1 Tax=Rhodoblastus sp. TaxID=1962975 RepID=UPI003F9B70E7